MPRCLFILSLLFLVAGPLDTGEPTAELLKNLRTATKDGPASPAARAAWDKLVARGPTVLPELLAGMDQADTVTANWLRTAFDRIVDTERAKGGKAIDTDALLAFVKDAKHHGRPRRLALETVEQLRPGTADRLMPGWLNDSEFRYDAVAFTLRQGDALAKDGAKEKAIAAYRTAFAATRDVGQAQALATRLKKEGVAVRIADHLGFLTEWYVIGPFDAKGTKGFQTVYPPEQKIDLAAELPGADGPLKWKRYSVREAWTGLPARACLVNLVEPLGESADAVGYAYTAFTVPAAQEAEFRGAADDNFTIWVNGKRVFGFEEYRNGVRLDRHRFKVPLQAGVNTVLVKVCQAPVDPTNPAPNWEFLLRVVDPTGKGIEMKSALPDGTK
jgi:hypothetical protein